MSRSQSALLRIAPWELELRRNDAKMLTLAFDVSDKWSVISDPGVSYLLPAATIKINPTY